MLDAYPDVHCMYTRICKFDWSNHCVLYPFWNWILVCVKPSLTDLRSKYPAGLKSEPELSDLMNEVAAVIPDKWQQVGIVLNMSDGDLASFVQLDSQKCFISVFTTWKNKQTSPYTWQTVVKALQSPTVGENKLAKDINSKLE